MSKQEVESGLSEQLKAGEISLIEITPEDAEAKQRLDRNRERRRVHRQNNLEQVRAYERNRSRNKTLSK